MGFNEKVIELAELLPQIKDKLKTEEATKNALIMPFLQILGYNIFNPLEVIPEFTADTGFKKGEKVDYAIKQDDKVIIIIECKQATINLNETNIEQLHRYFHNTNARIAILTNGVVYRFFSDLEDPNKMDLTPFLELDFENIRENLLKEVEKLSKEQFDIDTMLSTANDLKYITAIKKQIIKQMQNPEEEFVKYFFNRVTSFSQFNAKYKEPFKDYVKKAFQQFKSETIKDSFRSAMAKEDAKNDQPDFKDETDEERNIREQEEKGIYTTQEELEGYAIVKAIVCRIVESERIFDRDTKSYFGILFDDNNRKPVCRLHFNSSQKYIGVFDENKNEKKHPIEKLSDIYKLTDELIKTVELYI